MLCVGGRSRGGPSGMLHRVLGGMLCSSNAMPHCVVDAAAVGPAACYARGVDAARYAVCTATLGSRCCSSLDGSHAVV
jgi:hypothetical protein